MSNYLIQRDGYYYYFRRVPKHIRPYDSRRHIKISLKTTDKATAIKRAIVQNEAIEKFWRDVMKSPATEEQKDNLYQQSVQSARAHGFVYRDISDLSENASSAELGAALIGTAEQPEVTLSETWDIYRPKCGDRLIGKTEHQIRKWENPRKLAVKNFIEVIGNKNILDVNRKDILAFNDWWLKRVTEEGKKPASANKNFRHIKDILDTAFVALDLEPLVDVQTLFAKIKLKVVDDSRKSYEADYIQNVFLNSNALNGLNDEAKALFISWQIQGHE